MDKLLELTKIQIISHIIAISTNKLEILLKLSKCSKYYYGLIYNLQIQNPIKFGKKINRILISFDIKFTEKYLTNKVEKSKEIKDSKESNYYGHISNIDNNIIKQKNNKKLLYIDTIKDDYWYEYVIDKSFYIIDTFSIIIMMGEKLNLKINNINDNCKFTLKLKDDLCTNNSNKFTTCPQYKEKNTYLCKCTGAVVDVFAF